MKSTVDITPTPRILRTLGDIPFDVWQCVAELADNSLDAFQAQAQRGNPVANARVDIHWSNESTPAHDREIIVEDNGTGMSIEQLQNAARAGYSNNDPINNLGLFGMGFNISTARLGDETIFISATKDSLEWTGIKINFAELIKGESFSAPVVTFPKASPNESGTRVIVKQLKEGVFRDIGKKASTIRKRLEVIYSHIIARESVELYLQGKRLRAHPHCVWGETRYVIRRAGKVQALQRIDRDLGETWFDSPRNRYLPAGEAAEMDVISARDRKLPQGVVKRSRRLKGWLGIQRFSDTSDFGIDFIRNGRKILVGEKGLFGFENPDTGAFILEYPVELGSTVGGRIVGEIHVDYLIPTYQKNGFDTTDIAWRLTLDALRGAGPILPKRRKLLGYDHDNVSPLGLLINAYRRVDPGTKNLALSSSVSREFRRKFLQDDPEYIPDDKWYRAAQEADKERGAPKPPADPGVTPTDDPRGYDPPSAGGVVGEPPTTGPSPTVQPPLLATTGLDELIRQSERMESLCGNYSYTNKTPAMAVTARKVSNTQIKISGGRKPFAMFQDGIEIDFIYDDTHHLLAEYPITPKQLLLQALAEKFSTRDPGVTLHDAFIGLVENHLADERINSESLRERAQAILTRILESLPILLGSRIGHTLEVIREVESEEESLAANLLEESPDLFNSYQSCGSDANEALVYISTDTLIRLVDKMPEEFLDGKMFTPPYAGITLGSDDVRKRLKQASVDKISNYLRDIRSLLKGSVGTTKYELIRYANTLSILEDRLV